MAHRIAINGYGRIGQCVLRALYENGHRHHFELVAINELADLETIRYLTRYDTTHGRFAFPVTQRESELVVDGDVIQVFHQPEPDRLPWQSLEVDLVLDCTGVFGDRASAARHLNAGADKVLLSQPGATDLDATVVYGINHEQLSPAHQLVSNASCTTNCIVPVIETLNRCFGIDSGSITTIHSVMNDQPTIDAYHHTDLRRTRSAMQSIIPVETGLSRGIDRILPELAGRFQATALRVPTINVSAMDMVVNVRQSVTVAEVNHCLAQAAQGPLKGVMGYTEEPLASCDFNHDQHSAIVDGSQTRVSGGTQIKVLAWFDNEWGFANRMLDVADHWLNQSAH